MSTLAQQTDELENVILGLRARAEICRQNQRWPAHELERKRQQIEVLSDLLERMRRAQVRGLK